MQLDLTVPAQLIWLPQGQRATAELFAAASSDPNPEVGWTLEDVVSHVAGAVQEHDQQPWALAGGYIFGPDSLSQAWTGLRAIQKYNT